MYIIDYFVKNHGHTRNMQHKMIFQEFQSSPMHAYNRAWHKSNQIIWNGTLLQGWDDEPFSQGKVDHQEQLYIYINKIWKMHFYHCPKMKRMEQIKGHYQDFIKTLIKIQQCLMLMTNNKQCKDALSICTVQVNNVDEYRTLANLVTTRDKLLKYSFN